MDKGVIEGQGPRVRDVGIDSTSMAPSIHESTPIQIASSKSSKSVKTVDGLLVDLESEVKPPPGHEQRPTSPFADRILHHETSTTKKTSMSWPVGTSKLPLHPVEPPDDDDDEDVVTDNIEASSIGYLSKLLRASPRFAALPNLEHGPSRPSEMHSVPLQTSTTSLVEDITPLSTWRTSSSAELDDHTTYQSRSPTPPNLGDSSKLIPVIYPDLLVERKKPADRRTHHQRSDSPSIIPPVAPNNMMTFLATVNARRLAIQLSGGSGGHIAMDGRAHPGNNTAISGTRSTATLHGGVNVLLGGAMLSGLILLVFLICYCCQRSARKNDPQFRTQYWLPDPEGPLEVFTLDAQTQRLERAAVFLPAESVDALMQTLSSSPPPAYHTVVGLGSGHNSKAVDSEGISPILTDTSCLTAQTDTIPKPQGSQNDLDGLPSYEAALKIEAQRHI